MSILSFLFCSLAEVKLWGVSPEELFTFEFIILAVLKIFELKIKKY